MNILRAIVWAGKWHIGEHVNLSPYSEEVGRHVYGSRIMMGDVQQTSPYTHYDCQHVANEFFNITLTKNNGLI